MQMTHSHSSLEMYVQCPWKFRSLRIAKEFKDFQGKAGEWGEAVHKALENRVLHGTPLPPSMGQYEQMAAYIAAIPGEKIGEQKLAMTIDCKPCDYFAKTAYLRGLCDLFVVQGDSALLIDYKTGSSQYANNDQAIRNCLLIFAHHPAVQEVHTRFIYFKDAMTKRGTYSRGEIPLLLRNPLVVSEAITASFANDHWPKKPSGLCGYCPVSTCEHNRKRR